MEKETLRPFHDSNLLIILNSKTFPSSTFLTHWTFINSSKRGKLFHGFCSSISDLYENVSKEFRKTCGEHCCHKCKFVRPLQPIPLSIAPRCLFSLDQTSFFLLFRIALAFIQAFCSFHVISLKAKKAFRKKFKTMFSRGSFVGGHSCVCLFVSTLSLCSFVICFVEQPSKGFYKKPHDCKISADL